MLEIVLAIVFLPFAGAALAPVVYRVIGERTAYFAAAIAAVCLALTGRLYATGAHGLVSVEWVPSLGVSLAFYVDGLALLISFLASGVGVLILTYSGGYMHGEPGQAKYYATLLAFMGSMLGVALAADLFALFTFWELTSLSSFLLVGHYTREASSQYAARKAMLVTVAGGLFMLAGFLLFAWGGGTTLIVGEGSLTANAVETTDALRGAGLFVPALLLLGIGAATKSAQVPFHVWLPNAMEAPTPVSAFLHSATMVKAGVYLVGRFRPFFLETVPQGTHLPEWSLVFVTLGLLTMAVTAILAVQATDIKELLAYSTASHLGLIVAGFGVANAYGAEAGGFHILNHASFKAALFLVAGIVAHEAGTRDVTQLRGLRHDLPFTALIAGVASLSMAGIPPFNGFYSKELLFEATYELAHDAGGLAWAFPAIAVFGSVFTVLYSLKFLSLFLGARNDALGHVHRPPLAMLAPSAVLGVVVAVLSVDPQLAVDALVGDVYGSTVPGDAHSFSVGLPSHLSPPVIMSAITVGTGLLVWPLYGRIHDGIRSTLRGPVRANWWYDGGVEGLTAGSKSIVDRVQTGLLRTYATWVFAATCAFVLGGYLATGVSLPALEIAAEMSAVIVLVLLVALVGAGAVGTAPSHIAGVLTLSILGFMVAVFFILVDAPDLALTQLVVETLVLVLFLLVLDRLPAYYGTPRRSVAIRDALLSVAVGATVFFTVVFSTAGSPITIGGSLSRLAGVPADHGTFFADYGGGHNVVNVVLVDFRAVDTFGEITVVAMAALSVLTLIRMRERGDAQ